MGSPNNFAVLVNLLFQQTWALAPDGMLRHNNLISYKQIQQLSIWVNCISETIMWLLNNGDDKLAFETYRNYLEDKNDL